MEILYLSQYYPPEMGAPASRVSELAKYWSKMGQRVTVITGMPNHPDGVIHPTYKWEYFKEEKTLGVHVLRVFLYATANKGVVKRIISFLSFMITSLILGLLKSHTDIVIATSPQLFVGLSGLIIAKMKKKPFVFEVRDIWPQSAVELGVIKNKYVIRAMEMLENILYSKANMIIIAVKGMKEILVSKGVSENKIRYIPNGIDEERFNMNKKYHILRKKHQLKDKFIIGYIGTIGLAHGLQIIPKAAAKIRNSKVHFVIIGDGAEKDELLQTIKSYNLKNVSFLGIMAREYIPSILEEIDLGFIHLKCIPFFENAALPSKLFEIMAAGKPILAGISGIVSDFIKENDIGYIFKQDDVESLVNTIENILKENKDILKEKGRKGKNIAIRDFNRKELAEKYITYLNDCLYD